ncbi:MAG TPA: acetate kinase, partial [Blastocatellia bacterium]|nr:acetate kinase [Blastocatellia bacterium]
MNVLVLNCGSSTIKFQLIATEPDIIQRNADRRLARGQIERIGGEAIITLKAGDRQQRTAAPLRD